MMKHKYTFAALAAFAFMFASPAWATLPGPTSATFAKGAKFTVAGYAAGKDPLTGFPVLVRISNGSPTGFQYSEMQHADATDKNDIDIAFVDMNGNGLPFEIDTWDTNSTSLIWVRLPSMQNGTEFVMCWGSSSNGKAVSSANPWSDYTGVWHMNDPGNGVTNVLDSTANHLDGTTVKSSKAVPAGKIGGARFITENTSNTAGQPYDSGVTVDLTNDPEKLDAVNRIVPEFTASFWVRPQRNNPQWWYFITRKASDFGPGWGLQQGADNDWKKYRAYGGSENDSGCLTLSDVTGLSQGSWTKVDAVWMSDKTLKIYMNGSLAKQGTLANQAANGDQTKLSLGGALAPTDTSKKNGRGVYGDMDEIRLRAGALSEAWIAADYAMVTNEEFLTAAEGAEEYEVNNNPLAALQVSDIGFTNAMVTVTVTSRGPGATSADVTVEVASSNDFALPVWTTHYTVNADNDVRAIPLTTLDVGTTYYARAIVSNNQDKVMTTPTASFATPIPGPVFSASVNTDHIAPNISLLFTGIGLGTAITSVTVQVSSTGDFTNPEISKAIPVNLTVTPTSVADIVLIGLPAASSLQFRFIAENTGGYANVVDQSVASALSAGDNVWSGLSEDIDDPNAYVFAGGRPAPDKMLYFTTPAGLSPVINQDTVMPSLRFTNGKTETVDTAYFGGYHSCGYHISGSGVLTFNSEKPIVHASYGTNTISNPIRFSRSNTQTVTITSVGEDNAWLNLNGTLLLPDGVSNTTLSVTGRGNTVLGGPSPDFMGELSVPGGRLTFASPNAMTNVSKLSFSGDPTSMSNAIGAPLVFPRVSSAWMSSGWGGRKLHVYGAPFVFPQATFEWAIRDYEQSVFEADWVVSNVVVRKNDSNSDACLGKKGAGAFIVKGETTWYNPSVKSYVRLFRGCFYPQTAAGLPLSGEFYVPNDHAWRSTLGLSGDFSPMLDGSSTPRFFQTSRLACWGFTGFGGERTVCWNADPTLNLTNTTSGSVEIKLADSASTNVAGKAFSDYYAYPPYFMFGNRSEFADGTILFLNPIRYEFGQNWDATTRFESTNHVVAARLCGSLKLGTSGKTWNFSGNGFGGYLALEAENTDFTGNVNVYEKGNLLVNSNLVVQSATVQSGSGLGGTGSLSTVGGTTVKSGGALFGGEWNRGGTLTIGGKLTMEGGSALRVEAGSSDDGRGCVKLAAGSTLKLATPIYVDVDTDPRVSPVRGASCKVLDWSEASFDSGSAPTRENFVVRPELNPDLKKISFSVRDDGLYVGYATVRCPVQMIIIVR